MKKIMLVLICIILITGCNKKEEVNYDKEYNLMDEKLIEYGKLVYENYQWLNEETKVGTYYIVLRPLHERNGYDISMFINPKTKKPCDLDRTRIEFIFDGKDENGNYIYSFNPIVICN